MVFFICVILGFIIASIISIYGSIHASNQRTIPPKWVFMIHIFSLIFFIILIILIIFKRIM